jgi:hypothetical protein
MLRNEESEARIRLAGRVLVQTVFAGGPPVLLSEIAQLRFFAESDEERAMPVEQLARIIIERERRLMGIALPEVRLRRGGLN